MASFDPQGQFGNDPSYLNYPRVVDMPATELSRPSSLVAGLLGEGVKAAGVVDTAIKEGIKNKAYEQVDPQRDQFTSALESVKKQLDNGTLAVGNRKSLLDANASADETPDLPDGVSGGIDRIQQLAQAYGAGSPKINDTQYSAATLSIAKQLRAQYPGYREEVDQAVSQASGLPVANSYYQNLMTDINRQLQQMKTKKEADPVGGMMLKNMDVPGDPAASVPNMGVLYQMRQAQDPKYPGDAYVMKKISDWQNLQSQQKIDAATRAELDGNKKVQIENETKNVAARSNNLVAHYIQDNLALAGMDSLRDLTNYFSQVAATGKYEGVPQGDTQVHERQIQLANYRNMIYQQLKTQTVDSEGVLGAKAVEDMRQTAMSPIDGYLTLAGGKDANPPLALAHMQRVKNIQQDTLNNVLVNKDTGVATRQLLAARAIYGDQYFPQWIQNADPKIQESMQGLFQQEKLFAVQDAESTTGPLPKRTLIDAVKHAKEVQNPDPNLYSGFISIAQGITDPKMPATMKDKLIEWGFQPKNQGLLNEFKQDYRDKDGNLVPGKFAAFQRLFAPAMVSAVAESAKANPENYHNFRSMGETEFANAFRGDLADLNKVMAKPYLGVHFGWNSDNGHISLVDKNNRPVQKMERAMAVENPNQVYINGMLDTLDRVNRLGIDNLTRVFSNDPTKPQGSDIGSYLLNTLQRSGFRPGENVTNASEGMARAIIKAKKPEATLEDIDKTLGLR